MKKSIIALMGLFTLVACSEDSYQETDKMNESGAVENTGPQNSVKTIDSGTGYNSPFKYPITFTPEYKAYNVTTNLSIEFSAYVGLGYYDGSTTAPNYFGTPLSTSLYPNLYKPTKKYGNLVQSNVVTLNAGDVGFAKYGSAPVLANPTPWPVGPNFNLTFPSSVNASEINLLHTYGKIHFINYKIKNSLGAVIQSGNVYSRFVPNIGSFPGGTLPSNYQVIGTDAVFNRQLLAEASREIVVTENTAAGDFPHEINFTDGGQNYNFAFALNSTTVHIFLTQY